MHRYNYTQISLYLLWALNCCNFEHLRSVLHCPVLVWSKDTNRLQYQCHYFHTVTVFLHSALFRSIQDGSRCHISYYSSSFQPVSPWPMSINNLKSGELIRDRVSECADRSVVICWVALTDLKVAPRRCSTNKSSFINQDPRPRFLKSSEILRKVSCYISVNVWLTRLRPS